MNAWAQANDQRCWVSVLQVFPFGESGYSESTSVCIAIVGDTAQRISCKLIGSLNTRRLRIDPCNHPALVEITYLALRDQQGNTLWIAERLSANELTVTGNCSTTSGIA
jgi:hypothetical protein